MVNFVSDALRFVVDTEARMAAQEGGHKGNDEVDEGDENDENGENGGEEDEDEEEEENDDNDDDRPDAHGSRPAHILSSRRQGLDERRPTAVLLETRAGEALLALWAKLDRDAGNNEAQREAQLEALLNLLKSFFFTTVDNKPFSSGPECKRLSSKS
jgi:hypothetical protein